MEKVTTLVVDKTGTLTEGKPRVTRIITAGGISEDDLLAAAATAEQQSEHPLASAILAAAKDRNLPLGKLDQLFLNHRWRSNGHGCTRTGFLSASQLSCARMESPDSKLWKQRPRPSRTKDRP